MTTCSSLFSNTHIRGWRLSVQKKHKPRISTYCLQSLYLGRKGSSILREEICTTVIKCHGRASAVNIKLLQAYADLSENPLSSCENVKDINLNVLGESELTSKFIPSLILADLDPATAKLAIGILGPFLSAFAFLFILRIVMSWYPKLPVGKFPYIIAYAPTEPILVPTRKVIPPVGGVDVTPVVWFGLVSFLNEILVGPHGLLVLISKKVN